MLDPILSVWPFSSFTQTSSESMKIYKAKDSILTVLCLCTSLFRVLYKECKHTLDLTWMWVALDLCQSTTVLHHGSFPDEHHLTNPSYGLDDLVQPLHNWKCERGGLIIVSCPRALVALDHPVAVESPCWMIFQQVFSASLHLLYLCAWVEPRVA